MNLWMWTLFGFIILQRLVELLIAKSNERWMKARGGIEKFPNHYKWFIVVHSLFFLSIIIEVYTKATPNTSFSYILFSVFILTQITRVWCIQSLGKFWNTKIIILPGVSLIRKGPYKYVRHPNYIIVGLELLIIPLLFHAYYTAIAFPILHVILLTVRIPYEEKALNTLTEPPLKDEH